MVGGLPDWSPASTPGQSRLLSGLRSLDGEAAPPVVWHFMVSWGTIPGVLLELNNPYHWRTSHEHITGPVQPRFRDRARDSSRACVIDQNSIFSIRVRNGNCALGPGRRSTGRVL